MAAHASASAPSHAHAHSVANQRQHKGHGRTAAAAAGGGGGVRSGSKSCLLGGLSVGESLVNGAKTRRNGGPAVFGSVSMVMGGGGGGGGGRASCSYGPSNHAGYSGGGFCGAATNEMTATAAGSHCTAGSFVEAVAAHLRHSNALSGGGGGDLGGGRLSLGQSNTTGHHVTAQMIRHSRELAAQVAHTATNGAAGGIGALSAAHAAAGMATPNGVPSCGLPAHSARSSRYNGSHYDGCDGGRYDGYDGGRYDGHDGGRYDGAGYESGNRREGGGRQPQPAMAGTNGGVKNLYGVPTANGSGQTRAGDGGVASSTIPGSTSGSAGTSITVHREPPSLSEAARPTEPRGLAMTPRASDANAHAHASPIDMVQDIVLPKQTTHVMNDVMNEVRSQMNSNGPHRRSPVDTALRRRYTEAAFSASPASQPALQRADGGGGGGGGSGDGGGGGGGHPKRQASVHDRGIRSPDRRASVYHGGADGRPGRRWSTE